jgi:hypothetical protein
VPHYLVANAEQAFVWERDTHNAEHAVPAAGDSLCVTNYLLHRGRADAVPDDASDNASANDTYERSRILQGGVDGTTVTRKGLWDLLESR